jgi:hypothetical protein
MSIVEYTYKYFRDIFTALHQETMYVTKLTFLLQLFI